MLWTLDQLVVPTGLVGGMIRLGNLMNHEIYGHATDLPWGFRFITNIPIGGQGQNRFLRAITPDANLKHWHTLSSSGY